MNLEKLTDKQKLLLTKFGYIKFDMEEVEKLQFKGTKITIDKLYYDCYRNSRRGRNLISGSRNSYLNIYQDIIREKIGTILETPMEIISELREMGFGDLTITDIARDDAINFNAIAFNMGDRKDSIRMGDKVDVLHYLELNRYNGIESVQLNVKDIKKSL